MDPVPKARLIHLPRRQGLATLVVGERDSGKTAYLSNLARDARRHGLTVAGCIAVATRARGVKVRYHLRDPADPRRRVLVASTRPDAGLDQRVGRFHLSGAAFAEVHRRVAASLHADLVCLDEIGPLELEGGGLAPTLDLLARRYGGWLVLTVRPPVAPHLIRWVGGEAAAPRARRLVAAGRESTHGDGEGFPTPRRNCPG